MKNVIIFGADLGRGVLTFEEWCERFGVEGQMNDSAMEEEAQWKSGRRERGGQWWGQECVLTHYR